MTFKIQFKNEIPKNQDALAIITYENCDLSDGAKKLNQAEKKIIDRALSSNNQFKGKSGDILILNNISSVYPKIVVIGVGNKEECDGLAFETVGGKLWKAAKNFEIGSLAIDILNIKTNSKTKKEELAAHLAMGMTLAAYSFDKYKSKKPDHKETELKKITIVTEKAKEATTLFNTYSAIVDGVYLARDLVNEPPNTLYPVSYVQRIKDELKPLGVEIEVLDEKKMAKLGFGALLAVGQGSARESQTVIMRWNGVATSKSKAPIAFVGKGVTFDTGGISLKPGAEMDLMKMDMGGSAAVVGTMKALAGRKAKVNAIGIVGLVENMPSSNAYRPGDIITSHAGKTIEVLNTDAEGRLVLADILTYIQQTYKPKVVIDLATLTGAIMVALGFEYCGAFSNDDNLWKQVEKSSANTGEKFWRMPLDEAYKKEMESEVADLKNLGSLGRYGGACSAAGFLQHFIEDGTQWMHIDIAGTAWWKSDKPTTPKGGTGFGVRVLDDLVKNNFEK